MTKPQQSQTAVYMSRINHIFSSNRINKLAGFTVCRSNSLTMHCSGRGEMEKKGVEGEMETEIRGEN